ncbi:hypothetical protein ABEB36_013320 [Hypothenemus hampei]|uniref:Ammonium transporter AmtB-like domain-containing protein n=1 Tax=Hypothenemus hampei TaxID=57062 RepID=A0ABD1EC03_HYPHA
MAYFEDNAANKFFEAKNLLDDFANDTLSLTSSNNNFMTGDSITSAIRIICVLLLRIGFILIQAGSIPVENSFMIIFRNIVEIAVTIFSYAFIGYYLSFGTKTFYGIMNYSGYIGNEKADLSSAALGFASCLLGTAITSSLLVARLKQIPMLILTFFTSAFLIPIFMCWTWTTYGWMTTVSLMEERVAIKDYGGNLVVHVPSAMISLIGALFLGRRIVKLKDVDRLSLGNEYSSGIVMGYFFIMIGHVGANLPTIAYESKHAISDHVSQVTVNSLMAIGGGFLIVTLVLVVLTRDIYRYWIIVKCLQGGLAGLVTVAAGIDIYSSSINFGIACGGAMIFFLFSNLIHYSALEDCCNMISIYFICGIIGALIPPILGGKDNLGLSLSERMLLIHTFWQFLCLFLILLVTTVIYLTVFTIFYLTGTLKNQYEEVNHQRARILYGRLLQKKYFERFFAIKEENKDILPESNEPTNSLTIV